MRSFEITYDNGHYAARTMVEGEQEIKYQFNKVCSLYRSIKRPLTAFLINATVGQSLTLPIDGGAETWKRLS